MYLSLLSEKEKELFLGLAFNLAVSDGNYSDEEKAVMNEYCREMQYELNENNIVKSTDILIEEINSTSNMKVKKIIIFELIGLAMTDNCYHDEEGALIRELEIQFGIDEGYAKKCKSELTKYIEFQTELNQFVLG